MASAKPFNNHEGDPNQTDQQRMDTLRAEIAELESRVIDPQVDSFKANAVDAMIHGRKHELARLLRETSEQEAESSEGQG